MFLGQPEHKIRLGPCGYDPVVIIRQDERALDNESIREL